jgi:hypothetical protein
MPKDVVSQEDLVRWMNSMLALQYECKDCRFTSVMLLNSEDEDGCNWSSPNFRCSGTPAEVCMPVANEVVRQARMRFNLE